MSGVPAMHHIVRHRVDDCTIVVIVSGGKGDRKKDCLWGPKSSQVFPEGASEDLKAQISQHLREAVR